MCYIVFEYSLLEFLLYLTLLLRMTRPNFARMSDDAINLAS